MALIMGILLPAMLFSVAEKLLIAKKPPKEMPEDSIPIETESDTVSRSQITVPVLLDDGTVEIMAMDSYLIRVLLGEMPVDFDIEALKAQAVVARTYALKRNTTGQKHIGGAVCTVSSCCQSYRKESDHLNAGGTSADIDKVKEAVHSTTGQVLVYGGNLIEATYFSCSGGRTEEAQAVWGTDIPYLQSVDSPGEENAKYHTDNINFTTKEFAARLNITATGSAEKWLGTVTYTSGGGVATMVIAGKTFSGTELRNKLGLRSTAFTIMVIGDKLLIQTRGFGHRVGMSQYGAEAMAVSGSNYEQILMHYYPGSTLESCFEN